MTSTPAPDAAESASASEPSPARTVELLTAAALRATTPESAAPGPKLPPYTGD